MDIFDKVALKILKNNQEVKSTEKDSQKLAKKLRETFSSDFGTLDPTPSNIHKVASRGSAIIKQAINELPTIGSPPPELRDKILDYEEDDLEQAQEGEVEVEQDEVDEHEEEIDNNLKEDTSISDSKKVINNKTADSAAEAINKIVELISQGYSFDEARQKVQQEYNVDIPQESMPFTSAKADNRPSTKEKVSMDKIAKVGNKLIAGISKLSSKQWMFASLKDQIKAQVKEATDEDINKWWKAVCDKDGEGAKGTEDKKPPFMKKDEEDEKKESAMEEGAEEEEEEEEKPEIKKEEKKLPAVKKIDADKLKKKKLDPGYQNTEDIPDPEVSQEDLGGDNLETKPDAAQEDINFGDNKDTGAQIDNAQEGKTSPEGDMDGKRVDTEQDKEVDQGNVDTLKNPVMGKFDKNRIARLKQLKAIANRNKTEKTSGQREVNQVRLRKQEQKLSEENKVLKQKNRELVSRNLVTAMVDKGLLAGSKKEAQLKALIAMDEAEWKATKKIVDNFDPQIISTPDVTAKDNILRSRQLDQARQNANKGYGPIARHASNGIRNEGFGSQLGDANFFDD